ncbi:TPA: hypothetical protein ACGW6R_006149 [Bacillus cereus]
MISSEVKEIRKEMKAHLMEIDDNFTKLYKLVEDKDVAIDVLNKRLFKNETTIERLKRQKCCFFRFCILGVSFAIKIKV